MDKQQMTDLIVTAKAKRGLTWEKMGEDLGMSPVWLASACLGMNGAPPEKAMAITEYLGLDQGVARALEAFPTKIWDQTVPTDPLIYRFYEIAGVYGTTLKEVIQEKFGDGIMSAIDFTMEVDKQEDPKGDRVVVTMNGKFLPYKHW
ncbi:cyanate hydratase [Alcanivorax xiamenensis]|uniref:Cyanate hydratase n=1 Tax=Alcanivorax xiamenensis TaxID=1177156 RepID=A0ABQ6YC48_9GAMM|nr:MULTISPECIES: cyanase [Alcanivorax]KAF0807441.1 cyanate hydratase [Alcanivorax xiamenensis]